MYRKYSRSPRQLATAAGARRADATTCWGSVAKFEGERFLVYARRRRTSEGRQVAIEFKGSHFERIGNILWGVQGGMRRIPIIYRQFE